MAKQSTPSPERATQSEGTQIPIEDANAEQATATSPNDANSGSNPPSPSGAAASAAAGDPAGSAAAGDPDTAAAGEPLEGEPEAAPAAEAAPSNDELVAKAQAEAKEWQDKFMRLHAEWDTYRRRTAEQREAEKARAAEKLVTSLLPVIDDFERTIDYAVKNGETGLMDGVKAVHTKFVSVLTSDGVQVIDPVGEAFGTLEAQAVATVPDESVPDETVHEVYQKGYKMGTKVLRPAMVTVTTGGPKRPKETPEGEE